MSALTLDAAKAHLNINSSTNDTELQTVIDSAEAQISQTVGPLTPVARDDMVTGGVLLVLPVSPVVSLSSVATVGAAPEVVDVSGLLVDGPAGLVRALDGSRFCAALYRVTYQAGWASVPADLLFAVKEQVRHLWQTQRGGIRVPEAGGELVQVGYAMPNRVLELIAPYRNSVVG